MLLPRCAAVALTALLSLNATKKNRTGRATVRLLPATAVPEFNKGKQDNHDANNSNPQHVNALTIHVQMDDGENGSGTIEFQMNRDPNESSLVAMRRLELTAKKHVF